MSEGVHGVVLWCECRNDDVLSMIVMIARPVVVDN